MKTQTRRTFLKSSLITTAALSAGCKITSPTAVAPQSAQSAARVRGANEDIRIAVVGFGSRGGSHINAFKKMDGVRLVAARAFLTGVQVANLAEAAFCIVVASS